MNEQQTQVFAACLISLCELTEQQMEYALQILTAQAQGPVLSALAACLSELDKIDSAEDRAAVLRMVRSQLSSKTEAPPTPRQEPPSSVVSIIKTAPRKKWQSVREALDNYPPTRGQAIEEVAQKYGIPISAFQARIGKLGWTVEEALTTPIRAITKGGA